MNSPLSRKSAHVDVASDSAPTPTARVSIIIHLRDPEAFVKTRRW